MTNSWQETAEERDSLLLAIRDLEQANLTAQQLSQQKIKNLQKKLSKLSKISAREKKKLAKQILSLKIELEKKVQSEVDYQTKIRKLEDNLMSLTNNLRIVVQGQIKEKTRADELKEEIQIKEKKLINLHMELVDLQNRLNTANDTINQQIQKISQKNQQLTDLSDQLTAKDKLIANLQTEITNLKRPPTFAINTNTKNKKTNELSGQLSERKKKIDHENDKTGTISTVA